jgi:DNA-directed RNA polymerase subunit RPC12/RpoP
MKAESKDLKFQKGTVIVCPNCKNVIATAINDIYKCDACCSKDWDNIESLSPFRCSECNTGYMSQVGDSKLLHTTDGWVG